MKKDECRKLMAMIDALYPNWHPSDASVALIAWAAALEPYTLEQAGRGLRVYCNSENSGFAPSVGQLISAIRRSETDPREEVSAAEAWEEVFRILERTPWDDMPKVFERLPEASRRALGSASALKELAQMPTDAVQSVEKSHFVREYRAQVARAKEFSTMPADIKQRIAGGIVKELEE